MDLHDARDKKFDQESISGLNYLWASADQNLTFKAEEDRVSHATADFDNWPKDRKQKITTIWKAEADENSNS